MTVHKHYRAPMKVIKVVKITKRLAFPLLNEYTCNDVLLSRYKAIKARGGKKGRLKEMSI